MDRSVSMSDDTHVSDAALRRALTQADAMLAGIGPILGHLLSAPDHSLFSDEIVARVRGMMSHLARQVLLVQAEATGQRERDAFADRHGEALAEHFQTSTALLSYCHTTAIEWQLTERLEIEAGLDPVMSPLLQQLIADRDSSVSSTGMSALAAQARFAQAQRRMELPLAELPGELFHETLLAWRKYCGDKGSDAVARAEASLRQSYDESGGRLVLLQRLLAMAEGVGRKALALEQAGAALFFTALASIAGLDRSTAVLSSHARQTVRMALALRAAGLEADRIDEVLLRLHPGAAPIAGLETIDPGVARGLVLDSSHIRETGS